MAVQPDSTKMAGSAGTLPVDGVGHGVRLCEAFGTVTRVMGPAGAFILRASTGRI